MTMQIFPPLPAHVEAALRASIDRFGVLVPVVKDQHGRILDGHHRSRIADEMKKEYRVTEMHVADDAEAKEIARTLNSDRRHLTEEQRREVVRALAGETISAGPGGREEVARHSPEAIAAALGVSRNTVTADIEQLVSADKLKRPAKSLGLDGRVRPTTRPVEPAKAATRGRPKSGAASRQPLPDFANKTGWAIRKEAEKLERIGSDDRLAENKDVVATHLRGHLEHTVKVCQDLLSRLDKLTGA